MNKPLDTRKRVADAAFLIALMVYIIAGASLVPVHGDEFMHMAMARDVSYLLHGQNLSFSPPVERDSEQELRLINGSINKTLIGIVWLLSGRDAATLPKIYAW